MSVPTSPSRRRALVVAGGALTLAGALAACGDASSPTPLAGAPSGAVAVHITDAPFPFDSVARLDLYVVRVDAKTMEPDSTEAARGADKASGNEDPSRGWVTVATPNRRVDLIALHGGITDSLGFRSLPVGTYRGFRLVLDVDSSSVTLKNGTTLTTKPLIGGMKGIRFPSAGTSGIKVMLREPLVVTSAGAAIVLDFDLARSFSSSGRDLSRHGLEFRPVVRGIVPRTTGTLAGKVLSGSATGAGVSGATIEILAAGTPASDTSRAKVVASARSVDAGAWAAAFLPAGTYAVRASKQADGGTVRTGYVPSVTVTAGTRTTGVDLVLP